MTNDDLRLDSFENSTDNSVSVSVFKKSNNSKKNKKSKCVLSFIKEESKNAKNKYENDIITPVVKPKLLDSVMLFAELFIILIILGLLTYLSSNVYLGMVYAVVQSLFLPITILFFFYRLDMRGNYKFSKLVLLFFAGVLISFMIEIVWDVLVKEMYKGLFLSLFIKYVVEVIIVLFIVGFEFKQDKNLAITTALLISCAIASGNAFTHAVISNIESLFISVKIMNESGFISLGAIVNGGKWEHNSIVKLLTTSHLNSIHLPLLLMLITIINGFTLRVTFFKNSLSDKRPFYMILLFLLTMVLCALASMKSPLFLFQLIYRAVSLIFALYTVYKIVEYSIKTETYQD